MPATTNHRPRRHRAAALLAAASAVCAALAAAVPATPAAAGPAPAHPDTLTIATNGSVDSLSPFLAQRALPTHIHRLIYDFLTNYDARDDRPVPALATSWLASADKLTWTFAIRDGMAWSDGKPVTADDIAWTYQLIMTNPDAATANGNFVANFKSVAAPDPRTLVVTLNRPQATMLALDIPVVPRHVWQSRAGDIGSFHNDTAFPVVGNGPFVLSGYAKDQYVELTANPTYWRGAPKFRKVIFKYYKDADAAVEAVKKGEAHFASGLTPAQFEALRGRPNVAVNKGKGKSFYALAVNPGATTTSGEAFGDGHPALRDQRVRQAIRYAIDTATLVRKTLGGYGDAGAGYLPPIFAANHWRPDPAAAYTYRPEKAGELLDAAGYRRGAGGIRVGTDGKPLTLRLFGLTQRAADTQNATYIAEWLKAVGIDVTTSLMDQGRLGDTETAGNYDLAFHSWITNPDPDYVLSIQTCGGRPTKVGATFAGDNFLCDPEYDRLYAQQLAEYDPAARSALVKRMQERLYTAAYVNVLYYPNVLEVYRSDVIGSMLKQPQPDGMYSGQDGYWSWWSAAPPAAGGAAASRQGPVRVAAGLAAVAVLGAGAVLLIVRRRRAGADERE